MKKANVLRLVLSVTLAAFLLCGCGNSKEAPAEEAPEVAAEEEVTEENEVEEEEEEQESVEEETSAGEEGAEEPSEEETSTDMPEAQVTTTVADISEFAQFLSNLDTKTPHIIIYNEEEGYVIEMGKGEYYHLQINDKIFLSTSEEVYALSNNIPGKTIGYSVYAYEVIPDYSEFEEPQRVYHTIFLKEAPDTEVKTEAYLYAPAD